MQPCNELHLWLALPGACTYVLLWVEAWREAELDGWA